MRAIPVFAGLGSEALFSATTLDTAARDALLPEAKMLLSACHHVFKTEIAHAVREGLLPPDDLDIADFDDPAELLRPAKRHRRNAVVQHTTLFLVQMLRYMRHLDALWGRVLGAAGFCAGILPAAVVATSRTPIELLSRAQDLFYVAVWVGIRSQSYRVAAIGSAPSPSCSSLPWSVVVDGLTAERARELQSEHVYLSAVNSPSCVTMSGRGDRLQEFILQRLPPGCRARPTNVHTLYHSRQHLADVRASTMQDLETRPLQLSTAITTAAPLCSAASGEWLAFPKPAPLRDLVAVALDWIFLYPVDWVAVQKTVVAKAGQEKTPAEILNFGPGYGVSTTAAQPLPTGVCIVDKSAAGPASSASCSDSAPPTLSGHDIAIVGMAVDAPGAPDAETLWKNLESGVNTCSEIPASRFHVDDFYGRQAADKGAGDKHVRALKTRYGNFLDNPFAFDNELFDVSRREAFSMDPQQRVLLQTAYRALENAGYVPDSTPSFSRATFGCWVGNATLDYTDNLRDNIDVYYSPGTLRAFQSARISYVFSWSGPSITLDTACSSSAVALHQAARSIAAGDCRAALVGGVNVITSPDMYLGLDRAHFLSPSGQCKAFDASADGYCRAEGCAAFVIKKVEDAVAEGDRILGIIKAVEINQSGNTHSITHPHVETQEQLFRRVLQAANVHPHQVTAVEMHGTGTQAGDPSEVESVRRVFCKGRQPHNRLHLTSIKANIGHSEAASGAMGLAKLLLMLQHQRIPPQISLKQLNSKIRPLGSDGAAIAAGGAAWPKTGGQPRLALLNNFGAGGSNAAVLLQEWTGGEEAPADVGGEQRACMLGLSAKSADALQTLRQALAAHLSGGTTARLRDVCATMTSRRQLYDHRVAFVAESVEDLASQLRAADASATKTTARASTGVVFAFSGQGSQYLGMGRELLSQYPAFAKTVDECDAFLTSSGQPSCKHIITGECDADANDPSTLQAFQSAVFVLEVALAQLLMSWNIRPMAVVGHSLGEYAALVVAGVLDVRDALTLVSRRAQLMMERCERRATGMLAVNASAAAVRSFAGTSAAFAGIEVACRNSAGDCVVGGPLDQLQLLKARLAAAHGTRSKLLDVPMAYHTRAMDPVLGELEALAATVDLRPPHTPVVSTVLGRTVRPGEHAFRPAYFADHCRSAVAFADGIDHFVQGEPRARGAAWIEVGPHPTLLPMLQAGPAAAAGGSALFVHALRKDVPAARTVAQLLGRLFLARSDVAWRRVFAGARLVDLPGMPFKQAEFAARYPREQPDGAPVAPVAPGPALAGGFVARAAGATDAYETPLAALAPLIAGHRVCGRALCPASVYHQMALAAVAQHEPHAPDAAWSLAGVSYVAPLLLDDATGEPAGALRVVLTPQGGNYAFQLLSPGGRVHCAGTLKRKPRAAVEAKLARQALALRRRESQFAALQLFARRAIYEKLFTRVVAYSEPYQCIDTLRISADGVECQAACRPPPARVDAAAGGLPAAEAIFMDVLLHAAGFVANFRVDSDTAAICRDVASAVVVRAPQPGGPGFSVFCTVVDDPDDRLIVADAYAADERGVMAVFKGMAFQRIGCAQLARAFAVPSAGGPAAVAPPSRPAAAAAGRTSSSAGVREVLARTCGVEAAALRADTRLDALGVDSLMTIELQTALAGADVHVSAAALASCLTVADLERAASQDSSGAAAAPPSPGESEPSTPPPARAGSAVRAIIAETSGAAPEAVSPDAELHALGIDSLMVLELEGRLQQLKAGVSCAALAGCQTVGDVERLIEDPDSPGALSSQSASTCSVATSSPGSPATVATSAASEVGGLATARPPAAAVLGKMVAALRLTQQPELVHAAPAAAAAAASPLFLIHDGSGVCVHYHRLRPLGRSTYAIHNPNFLDSSAGACWPTLQAMAAHYAGIVSAAAAPGAGPVLLGGWSFGGVVAFEAARALLAADPGRVAGVVLIDSPPPVNHQPLSPAIIDAVTGAAKKSHPPPPAARSPEADEMRALTRRNFLASAALLADYVPDPAAPVPRVFLLRSERGWRRPPEDGTVDDEWNPWLQDRADPRTAVAGWESVLRTAVPWADIPGDHFQAFDHDNIDRVSAALASACDRLEAEAAATQVV
ncbi:hypothetical protein MPH_13401 [Macrophomina phaseolina MS6]|uniref:Beta-ketoacyl synthase n=1 Tax=Macrophomina phaseolina (strain MS6) TaxID=1126212 RepID=K2QIF6_MACPH|nr:hypothetical protein MPH_13401 [Macrophomina phaseolina MS6]